MKNTPLPPRTVVSILTKLLVRVKLPSLLRTEPWKEPLEF